MLPTRPLVSEAQPSAGDHPLPSDNAETPKYDSSHAIDDTAEKSTASWVALKRAMHSLTVFKTRTRGNMGRTMLQPSHQNQDSPPPPREGGFIVERQSLPGIPEPRNSVNLPPQVPRTHSHFHTLPALEGGFTQSANFLPNSQPNQKPCQTSINSKPPLANMTRLARTQNRAQSLNTPSAKEDVEDACSSPLTEATHALGSLTSLPTGSSPEPSPLTSLPEAPSPLQSSPLVVIDEERERVTDVADRGLLKQSSMVSNMFSSTTHPIYHKTSRPSTSTARSASTRDPSYTGGDSITSRSEGSAGGRYVRNFPSVKSKAGSQLFALTEEPAQEEEGFAEHINQERSIRRIEEWNWDGEMPPIEASFSALDTSADSFTANPPNGVHFSFPITSQDIDFQGSFTSGNSSSNPSIGLIPSPPLPASTPFHHRSPFMRMDSQSATYQTISSFSSQTPPRPMELRSSSDASEAFNNSSSSLHLPYHPIPSKGVQKSPGTPLFLRVGSRLEQGEWVSQGWVNNDIKINPSLNQLLYETPLSFVNGAGAGASSSLQVIEPEDLKRIKELGRGATGRVWMAKWRGVEVALKEILDEGSSGLSPAHIKEKTEDPFHEARILKSLSHPCFIHLYGVVQEEGSRAMIVELVRGGSLRSGLRRLASSFSPGIMRDETFERKIQRVKASIAVQAARGMEYFHSCSFVHFDLKSENLLCDLRDLERVVVKVSDLGLSAKKSLQYIEGNMRGTLPWMAPELFYQGDQEDLVTEKVDVWSFGVVLWEIWCLCQSTPYEGMSSDDLMAGLLTHTLKPTMTSLPAGTPVMDEGWRSILERCCESDPKQRPSFTEIAETLEAMEEEWRAVDSNDSLSS